MFNNGVSMPINTQITLVSLSKHRNSNSLELHRLQTLVLRYRVTRFRVWWPTVRPPPTRRFCFLRVSLLGCLFTTGDKWYLKQVKFDKLYTCHPRGLLFLIFFFAHLKISLNNEKSSIRWCNFLNYFTHDKWKVGKITRFITGFLYVALNIFSNAIIQ